ncbi:MAG: S9 family peptidase [Bryobacteraceae bacterium]
MIRLALALLVGAGVLLAQRPLTAEDTLSGKLIGEVQLSPDGSRIAFTLSTNDTKNGKASTQVLTMPSAGGDPKAMKGVPDGASSLRWSPDGKKLAYIARDGGGQAIFVTDAASGKQTKVCAYDHSNSFLAHSGNSLTWSPDSKQIAFAGTMEPKPAPPDPMVVTRILYKTRTSYSDNRRTHIYVVPASGGTPKAVTSGNYDEHSIDWGGREIVFLSNRDRDPDANLNYDIFAVTPSSGGVRQLTHTPGVEMDPQVSPDGKWIAYTATKRRLTTIDSMAEDTHIWVVSSDGGEGREIGAALDRRETNPEWSADSKSLFFTGSDHGKSVIYRVLTQNGDTKAVVDRNGQASNLNVAKDGSIVFTMSDPSMPGELFRATASGEPQQLTSLNTETISAFELSKPERFSYPSFDSTRVEGFFYPALGVAAGAKKPMILMVHGGPHGANGLAFNPAAQFYAARGYAVLALNPRGSSGYGQKFSDGSINNWGGGDYKDLMAGVDYVLKTHPEIDAQRLGVTGGSYGGFMTNWIVTQTNRFKAAVAVASVSDLVSFYATSLYQDLVHQEFNGYPWENYELLWKWSPMAHIKSVTTPLMLLHGEMDNDVHITQAEEMYTALRQRGVEAELVRYPREGHGFREPRHRVDALTRTVEWMDRHVSSAK